MNEEAEKYGVLVNSFGHLLASLRTEQLYGNYLKLQKALIDVDEFSQKNDEIFDSYNIRLEKLSVMLIEAVVDRFKLRDVAQYFSEVWLELTKLQIKHGHVDLEGKTEEQALEESEKLATQLMNDLDSEIQKVKGENE